MVDDMMITGFYSSTELTIDFYGGNYETWTLGTQIKNCRRTGSKDVYFLVFSTDSQDITFGSEMFSEGSVVSKEKARIMWNDMVDMGLTLK